MNGDNNNNNKDDFKAHLVRVDIQSMLRDKMQQNDDEFVATTRAECDFCRYSYRNRNAARNLSFYSHQFMLTELKSNVRDIDLDIEGVCGECLDAIRAVYRNMQCFRCGLRVRPSYAFTVWNNSNDDGARPNIYGSCECISFDNNLFGSCVKCNVQIIHPTKLNFECLCAEQERQQIAEYTNENYKVLMKMKSIQSDARNRLLLYKKFIADHHH
jgi:hypothetical protein